MNELVVVAFRDKEGAQQLLAELSRSARTGERPWFALETAVVTRDATGKFLIRDCLDLSQAKGRRALAAWRLLVAVLVSGPLGGTIWGAGTARLWKRLAVAGLDERFMTSLPAVALPGGSALFLLLEQAAFEPARHRLSAGTGRVYHATAPDEVGRIVLDALSGVTAQPTYE